MRFLLTADEFGAAEALRIGLVQEITPVGHLLGRAVDIARRIAAQAPLGVQATIANARAARAIGERAAIAQLRDQLSTILTSEDAAEGLASFVERRPGRSTGS